MGVQGLLTYIVNTPSARKRVHLKHLSHDIHQRTGQKGELLCDYFSVIHWLLSTYDWTLTHQGKLPLYSLLYGGDLRQYGPRVVSFVKALESIDIVPVFFIDGPPGTNQTDFVAKFSELKSRYLKKVELGAIVQQICDGNNDLLQAKWSLREGVSTQVEFALKSAGVNVVYCLGEADCEMLKYLQFHDSVCGILSTDTDFAVAYGSKLFLPEYFDLNKDLGISSDSICEYPEDIVCEVVTPASVASALKLAETQLADLAVLCGNDFTRHINAKLLAAVGLSDSKVETVAEWLQEQSDSLLENETVVKLFAQHSHFRSAIEHTYNTQFKCLHATPTMSRTPLVEFVHQMVTSGSMSPHLLSIVNGTYWRLAVTEPVALGQPCCNDLTVFLRRSVYALMAIGNVREYGRTASKSFAEIPLSISCVVTDGLQQLRSMRELTINEKLITLFYVVVNYSELEQPSDLHDIQARAHKEVMHFEGEMSIKAIVACACLLFMHLGNTRVSPSPRVAICEVEALVVTCLACAAQLPPCIMTDLPPARAVTLGMWFTHVVEQVYIVASCIGLYEHMPKPADIFSTLAFIPYHIASYDLAGMDEMAEETPTEDSRPHMVLFTKLFTLSPVLALRAEILNKWSPPDIPYLLHLFHASLEEISLHREFLVSCCHSTPEPLAELEVSLDTVDDERSSSESLPEDDPQFELDLDSENSDVKVFTCESDGSTTAADYGELPSTLEGYDTEECIYLSSQSQGGEVANLQDVINSQSVETDASWSASPELGLEEESQSYTFVDVPDGTDGVSPLTFRQDSSNHRLPVLEHRDKILELINGHRVVCIEGETGCGKSTKIPQFILDDSLQKNPVTTCKILVTQPRRVAAIKLAERVAAEREERVGKTVGYCIGGERHRSPATPLTYCTTGYMLQALVHNPGMIQKYTHIILDEVHERSIDADFAMLVVRSLTAKNPDVKIIVMSATMQGPLLVSYFEEMFKCEEVASPYFVGVKRYPIRSFFMDTLDVLAEEKRDFWNVAQNKAAATLQNLITSRPKEVLKTVLSSIPQVTQFAQDVCTEVIISQANLGESILVFLPGIAEISHYYECLTEELIARDIENHFSVFVLHSQVPLEDQKEAFDTPLGDKIHVILATNIAESSITFPKLRMVINFGIYRQLEYDSKRRISCLVKKWSSHASCSQRAGRAGRVFEGVAVHLFSRQFYEVVLPEYDPPEMLTAPLAKLVLRAKQIGTLLGVPSPSSFLGLALNPPSLQQLEAALQDLADLGAITSDIGQEISEEAEITLLGHFSLSLPVDLVLCRLILFGIFFGCPIDSIVIAASLSLSQDVFSLPSRVLIKDDQQFCKMLLRSMESRFFYDEGSYSDAIMVCNLFRGWIAWLNASCIKPKPLPKHTLVRQFASASVVRWERMLQLEATVSEIASRVLVHVPEAFVLHEQLRRLASLRVSRGAAYTSTGKSGKCHQRTAVNLHFCEDPSILKALLAASFSHQILYGVRECDSFMPREKKRATSLLETMAHLNFDRSRTLVMRGLKHPTSDALQQLTARVLPNHFCQVRITDNVGFIHFNRPFETNPKTELIRQQQGSQECAQSRSVSSVAFSGLPQEAHFLWQFGERRPVWRVEGVNAEFTSPRHPCTVAWYRLSHERESARVISWRNRTGFVYDLRDDCGPFLGIASTLQGGEVSRFISAKGITVLPSFQTGPSALLMVLSFQPLHGNLELGVDVGSKKITSIRCNSQEISFDGRCTLEADDIIRVNALREAISKALSSSSPSATIPMETTATILPLLDCVLNRKALVCNRDEAFADEILDADCPLPLTWEEAIVHREVADDDSDIFAEFPSNDALPLSLKSFCFYPPIQCSLVKSVEILPIPKEEMRISNLFHRKDSDGAQTQHRTCRRGSAGQLMNTSDDLSFKLSPYAKPFVPTGVCSDPAALEKVFLSPACVPVPSSMATGEADSAGENCDTDLQEPVVSDSAELCSAETSIPGCGSAALLPPLSYMDLGLQQHAMLEFVSWLFSNLGIVADPAYKQPESQIRLVERLPFVTSKFLQQLALQSTPDTAKQLLSLQPCEARQESSAPDHGHKFTCEPLSLGIPAAASIGTQTKHDPLVLQGSPKSPSRGQRAQCLSAPLTSQSTVLVASQVTDVSRSMQSPSSSVSTPQSVSPGLKKSSLDTVSHKQGASASLNVPRMDNLLPAAYPMSHSHHDLIPRSQGNLSPRGAPSPGFPSMFHHSPPPAHMLSESSNVLHKKPLLPQLHQPHVHPSSPPAPMPTMPGSYPSSVNASSPLYPHRMRSTFGPATTSSARYSPPAWIQHMYQPMFSPPPQAPRGPRYTPPVRPSTHIPFKVQQQSHRYEPRQPLSNVRIRERRPLLQRRSSRLQDPGRKATQARANGTDAGNMVNFFEQYLSMRGGQAPLEELCGSVYRTYLQRVCGLVVSSTLNRVYFDSRPDKFAVVGKPGSLTVALLAQMRREDRRKFLVSKRKDTSQSMKSSSATLYSEMSGQEEIERFALGNRTSHSPEATETLEAPVEEKHHQRLAVFHQMEQIPESSETASLKDQGEGEPYFIQPAQAKKGSTDDLISYFERYLSIRGGEASLQDLCGPVYHKYRDQQSLSLQTVPVTHSLPPMFFERHPDKFVVLGKPGSFMVALTTPKEELSSLEELDLSVVDSISPLAASESPVPFSEKCWEKEKAEVEEEEKGEDEQGEKEEEEWKEEEEEVKEEKGEWEEEEEEVKEEKEEREEGEDEQKEGEEEEKAEEEDEHKEDGKEEEAKVIIPGSDRVVCSEELGKDELLPRAVDAIEVTDGLVVEKCNESVALSQQNESTPESSELTTKEVMAIPLGSEQEVDTKTSKEIHSLSSTEDVTAHTPGGCQPVQLQHTQNSCDAFPGGTSFELHSPGEGETTSSTPAQHSPEVTAVSLGDTDHSEYEEQCSVDLLSVEEEQQDTDNLSQLVAHTVAGKELKAQFENMAEPTVTFQSHVKLPAEEENCGEALPRAGGTSHDQSTSADSPPSLFKSKTCTDQIEQSVPSCETHPARKQESKEEPKVGSPAHMLQYFQKALRSRGNEGSSVHSLITSYKSCFSLSRSKFWIRTEFFRDYPDIFSVYSKHESLKVRLISSSQTKSVVAPSGSRKASSRSRRISGKSRRSKVGSQKDGGMSQRPLRNVGPRFSQVGPKGDVAAPSLNVAGVQKVEEEVVRIMCEKNRMAFLSDLKRDKKLAWLCQVCGVNLNRQFFRIRSSLFEVREEENFGEAESDCFLILRSQPALEKFCHSKKAEGILPLPSSLPELKLTATCSNKVGVSAATRKLSSSSLGSKQASQHVETTSSGKSPQRKRERSRWHGISKQQSHTDQSEFHETRVFRF